MLRIIDENGKEIGQILEKLFPKVLELSSAIQYVVDWEKVSDMQKMLWDMTEAAKGKRKYVYIQ